MPFAGRLAGWGLKSVQMLLTMSATGIANHFYDDGGKKKNGGCCSAVLAKVLIFGASILAPTEGGGEQSESPNGQRGGFGNDGRHIGKTFTDPDFINFH